MWNLKCSNRILDLKSKQQAHLRHLRALQKIKPSIKIHEPPQYSFLQYKAKSIQKMKQRNQEIESHNSMLVNRMLTAPSHVSHFSDAFFKQSLNFGVLKRKQSAIDRQNQKIVKRLQCANSKYSQRAMSKSVKSYYKAKSIMAASKMDQFYDFDSLEHKKSLDNFQNKGQNRRARPYSAKK